MTLPTDLGATPRLSIDRASASTSAVVTSATRDERIAGEMWTRCNRIAVLAVRLASVLQLEPIAQRVRRVGRN
jgi:hypothetical protein